MIFDVTLAEERIGYVFKDKMLLRKCFTHASYTNENPGAENNEILEFFGDSILEFVVTEYLCQKSNGDEGDLTELRKKYVSRSPLEQAVFNMKIDELMILGNGENKSKNKNEKMFSSLFEALIAGIYYDGGLAPTKKFIFDKLLTFMEKTFASQKSTKKDNKNLSNKAKKSVISTQNGKSAFQEYVQKNKLGVIAYEERKRSGPDHAPVFEIALTLNGKVISLGKGTSKKIAETDAAEKALKKIRKGKTK